MDDTRPRAKRTFNQAFAPARVHEKTKKGLAHVVVSVARPMQLWTASRADTYVAWEKPGRFRQEEA